MEDELRKILINFTKYDENGDGNLDANELEKAIKDATSGNFSSETVVEKLVKNMIEAADSDKDGKLSIAEIQGTFFVDDFQATAALKQSQSPKQQAALTAVRSRLMEDEIRKIVLNFSKFEKNKDNTLDTTELTEAVKDATNGNFSSDEVITKLVKDMITAADSDNDGKLSVAEITGVFLCGDARDAQPLPQTDKAKNESRTPLQRVRARLMEDELRKILINFTKYDENGDGNLDASELEKAIKDATSGNFSSDAVVDKLVKDMIEAADSDKDGKLSIAEIQGTFFFEEYQGGAAARTSQPTAVATTATNQEQQQQPVVQQQEQTEQQQPQQNEEVTVAPSISSASVTAEVQSRVLRAFTLFDVRGRGWLSQSNAKRLLESTLFAHHPNRDAVVDQLISKDFAAVAEIPKIEVGNKEPRIKRDDFVRLVAARYPESRSAEEVASSFSALKNDSGSNKLSRESFVAAAVKANPAYTNERASVSWNRIFVGGNSSSSSPSSAVEYQPYRSVVNSVIHSTKIEAKA